MLCTDYKDYDVRSVDIVGSNGMRCQIWIDPPEYDSVTIHVWPYAPPHQRFTVAIAHIRTALEDAYNLALNLVAPGQ